MKLVKKGEECNVKFILTLYSSYQSPYVIYQHTTMASRKRVVAVDGLDYRSTK